MSPAETKFYFEDHIVDALIECGSYTVTSEEIIAFASKWDRQPWHIDKELARASMFGGLTACSAHIFSIYNTVSVDWQNGREPQALAGLGFDELRLHKPVYAGDTLRCLTRVAVARASKSRPDSGIIVYDSELVNQEGERVFSAKCSTLVPRRPDGPA